MEEIGSFFTALMTAVAFHLRRYWFVWVALFLIIIISGIFACRIFLIPPHRTGTTPLFIKVENGETTAEVASALATAQIIREPRAFSLFVQFAHGNRGVQAGTYRFDEPQSLYVVAKRLMEGETGITDIRVTFPEGESTRQMAARVARAFGTLSAEQYLTLAKQQEGYLFPDTYLFSPQASVLDIVNAQRDNFDIRIASITPEISSSGHALSEIVIMASLVEKEARTTENRRIVAGILWNRLAIRMPLQVDAVFGYIKGKDTYSPSFDDLTIDSPYNVYEHQGLPPGPINNPGLNALSAAANPIHTDYLFYLTDPEGGIHFAKTLGEHKLNRLRYLD